MALSTVRLVFNLQKLASFDAVGHTGIRLSSAFAGNYKYILTEKKGKNQNIGLVTMNKPKVFNAICDDLAAEVSDAFQRMDRDDSISVIILTGNEKSFAAGADISVMAPKTFQGNIKNRFLELPYDCKKPVIAAVNGYAVGGGCEFALMCDIIYAGDKAVFAQPEITIGTIPGFGGTQKIARNCGKSKAMEICLTGNQFSAHEAEKMGLVTKVFPAPNLLDETIKLAERIASHSPLIVRICKEAVNVAFETSLQEGLRFERKAFYSTFATEDRKEGMTAFVEKRKPNFKNN